MYRSPRQFYGNEDIYARYHINYFEENPMSSFAKKIQEKFEEGAVMKNSKKNSLLELETLSLKSASVK